MYNITFYKIQNFSNIAQHEILDVYSPHYFLFVFTILKETYVTAVVKQNTN